MTQKQLFRLSVKPPRAVADEDVRAENRRMRSLLDAMVKAVPVAASLVDVQWDIEKGRTSYTFCVPGDDEAGAVAALVRAMSDSGFPWGTAADIVNEAMRRACARHGLLDEVEAEAQQIAVQMERAAEEEIARREQKPASLTDDRQIALL